MHLGFNFNRKIRRNFREIWALENEISQENLGASGAKLWYRLTRAEARRARHVRATPPTGWSLPACMWQCRWWSSPTDPSKGRQLVLVHPRRWGRVLRVATIGRALCRLLCRVPTSYSFDPPLRDPRIMRTSLAKVAWSAKRQAGALFYYGAKRTALPPESRSLNGGSKL